MASFSRLKVLTTMIETGLVPVFYQAEVDTAASVIEACLEAGVRCVEFTNRGDRAHLVFEQLAKEYADDERLILGVGSVVDAGTASLYMQLGANFIVGPVLNPAVAQVCNRRQVAYSPGCGTVSEISTAQELGAEICKIFPGTQVGGPSFVKAVRAPMPWSRIMPTGGVAPTEENIRPWFEAGVACVGMGSKLITKESVAAGDFGAIKERAEHTLSLIRQVRQDLPPAI